jgi:hypothetical protein
MLAASERRCSHCTSQPTSTGDHSAGGTVPIEEQALLLHIDSHTAISLMLEKDQLCLCCFSLCTWSCLNGTAKR